MQVPLRLAGAYGEDPDHGRDHGRCGPGQGAGGTANARPEVKAQANYVTAAPGGSGAVREVVELILKAQGYWDEILRKYEV
jgi:hypothetical protein